MFVGTDNRKIHRPAVESITLTLGDELEISGITQNPGSAKRLAENEVVWTDIDAGEARFGYVEFDEGSALLSSLTPFTLTNSAGAPGNLRLTSCGVDIENRCILAGNTNLITENLFLSSMSVGVSIVEEDTETHIHSNPSANVGGLEITFMGHNKVDSFFCVGYVVNNGGSVELRFLAVKINISTKAITVLDELVVESALTTDEATDESIDVNGGARSDFDVIYALQGGYWYRAIYDPVGDTWTKMTGGSNLVSDTCASVISSKEGYKNDNKSVPVIGGLAAGATTASIEFIETNVVGESKQVSTDWEGNDSYPFGEAVRGVLPDGETPCIMTVHRDASSDDVEINCFLLNDYTSFSSTVTPGSVTISSVTTSGLHIAQLNRSKWCVVYRDNETGSQVVCQVINVSIGTDDPQLLFIEMGQSNMEGRTGDTGNGSYPFNSSIGALEYDGSSLVTLNTLRGDASEGSHANYFADRLHTVSGYRAVMAEAASGGAGLGPDSNASPSDNHWGAAGSLRGAAETLTTNALAATGLTTPYALWCQGERDAQQMDASGTYNKADAKQDMQDVIDWWFGLYPNSYFFISQTGRPNAGDTSGWQDMRDIQEEVANENARVILAFSDAVNFPGAGKMEDNLHYNETGYQDMGEALANSVVAVLGL